MNKSININWYTYEYIATAKYQDMFASFLIYKSLYSNSCIFNYSISALAKKANLSYKTVKRHIQWMTDKNWVRFHNGNLTFKDTFDIVPKSSKKYKPQGRMKIFPTSKQDIKDQLIHMFMVSKQRKVQRSTNTRIGKTNSMYKNVKLRNALVKKHGEVIPALSEIANDFVISYNRVGLQNKVSKSSSFRAIKRLRDSGMIHKRRNFRLIRTNASTIELNVLRDLYPKTHLVLLKGSIYRILPNSYCVLDKYSNSPFKDIDNDNNVKSFRHSCSVSLYNYTTSNTIASNINSLKNRNKNTNNLIPCT